MRKLRRAMMKAEAEHRHVKSSRFIKEQWHRYQIRKWNRLFPKKGEYLRMIHMVHGTHKRNTWKSRLTSYNT